ncbi:MAG TPA: S8 family serine peptidase [Candidatus Acidoferrum sp.]
MKRPVRIGIIDSGVNAAHPHVGDIAGGIAIGPDVRGSSYVDYLGHGTAVAALIHARAPYAELFAVKIFHNNLTANLAQVLSAIDWCLDHEMDLINLSLGTANSAHKPAFEAAVGRVRSSGKALVSAFEVQGDPALPGALPGVVGVLADSAKGPGEHGVLTRSGKKVFTACPFPRDIPGVPRERNLHGVSFAVAHTTATLSGLCRPPFPGTDWELLLANRLQAQAGGSILPYSSRTGALW